MSARLVLLCSLLSLPALAQAQCPMPADATVTDATSQRWDVNRNLAVVNGTDGAFDGGFQLFMDGLAFNTYGPGSMAMLSPETGGYSIMFLSPLAGMPIIGVERQVLALPGAGFVRYVDRFGTLDGTRPRTITIEYRTNVGYDDTMEVVATSDGDTSLEASDTWAVFDNAFEMDEFGMLRETPPGAFCHVIGGSGARIPPSAFETGAGTTCGGMFGTDPSGERVRFTITLDTAHPSERIMFFVSQHPTRAAAVAFCPTLAALSADRIADLDDDERASVINWRLDRGLGSVCSAPSDCTSGFCADGVCCDGACGGSATDCQACSTGAGAAADGTCGPVRSGRACRPSVGTCDLVEECNGTSTTCPTDHVQPAGFMCRASAGLCDRAESCTGTNGMCPPDTVLPRGVVCSPALPFTCDFGARCDGMMADCPPSFIGVDGAPCDDGVACTFARCAGGDCTSASASCDDDDMCTSDACGPDGRTCQNDYMPGCVGGRDAGPDSGELYPDAPEPDGGDPFFDAGGGEEVDAGDVEVGPGMDAGRVDSGPDGVSITGGGCVCGVGHRRASPGLGLAFLVVSLLLARRR